MRWRHQSSLNDCSASIFWVPSLRASGLCDRHTIYAYDFDGHGLSDFSGRDQLTVDDLVGDLKDFLATLGLHRVILIAHSMQSVGQDDDACAEHMSWLTHLPQIVGSLFAKRFPEQVEKMILLHPIRNLSPTAIKGILKRADAASTVEGLGEIASTVAASGVSKTCAASDFVATALIRFLVASTKPAAYAAACRALASAPVIDSTTNGVQVHFIGGEEDYLATPQTVTAWAEEAGGTCTILSDVGHWGAIEAPRKIGKEMAQALAPT